MMQLAAAASVRHTEETTSIISPIKTPNANSKARKMVSDILGAVQVESAHRASSLQIDQPMNTTTAVPPPVVEEPVKGEDGADA